MGCGCKTSGNKDILDSTSEGISSKKLGSRIISYTFKVLAFLLFIVFLPLLYIGYLSPFMIIGKFISFGKVSVSTIAGIIKNLSSELFKGETNKHE